MQIFPVLVVNSLCKNKFLIFFSKFPVFSLSGKMDFQIPCFPCAVATLIKNLGKTPVIQISFLCDQFIVEIKGRSKSDVTKIGSKLILL